MVFGVWKDSDLGRVRLSRSVGDAGRSSTLFGKGVASSLGTAFSDERQLSLVEASSIHPAAFEDSSALQFVENRAVMLGMDRRSLSIRQFMLTVGAYLLVIPLFSICVLFASYELPTYFIVVNFLLPVVGTIGAWLIGLREIERAGVRQEVRIEVKAVVVEFRSGSGRVRTEKVSITPDLAILEERVKSGWLGLNRFTFGNSVGRVSLGEGLSDEERRQLKLWMRAEVSRIHHAE